MEWKEVNIANAPKVRLTELLDFIVDNRGKTVPTSASGTPLIATNCIKNELLYPAFEKVRYVSEDIYKTWFRSHPIPGDIIFVNKGTPGKTALVPDPVNFCFAQDMMAFRVNSHLVYNKYLLAVLRSRFVQQFIMNSQVGTIIPHFKKEQLKSILIPLPTMEIQRKIGDFYFSLSEKCEVNRKINENLEQQAQALFKSWFVDFEPFQNGEFEDSELGRIPKGWKVSVLSEIANITMGQSPSGSSYNEEHKGTEFYQGSADFGWRFPKERVYTTEPLRFAKSNSVLMSVRAPVGTMNISLNNCCIGRGLASIHSKNQADSYVIYLMKSLKALLNSFNGDGTVFGSINKKALEGLGIIVPPKNIIDSFEKIVSPIDKLIRNYFLENTRLSHLRDTLLPKLMSGEIEV